MKNKGTKFLMYFVIFCYFLLFLYLAFSRHDGLKSYMNDLGNMDQAIYNTTRGDFMTMTNLHSYKKIDGMNRLGGHANFILLLFVPIYYFFANPKILLFTQTAMIALGALPLYWLGEKLFKKNRWLSLVTPFIYLANSVVHDVNLYDFHPIAVAMPAIMFAFYFMYTKRYGWFYFFAFLIAMCKEDMPLIVFMLGLYMFFVQKEKKKGMVVSLLSLVYFLFLVKILMPFFAGGDGLALVSQRYAHLGGEVGEIVINLITKPWLIFVNLISARKVLYMTALLLPVLFLPLLSLEVFLLCLPSLLINLLSSNSGMHNIFFFYYSAPILSFIFLATITSLYKLSKKLTKEKFEWIVVVLLTSSVVASFLFSPAPHSPASSWKEFEASDHAKNISEVKQLVPLSASLSVQNNLGPHFSQRRHIYAFPFESHEADFVLVDINDPYPIARMFSSIRAFYFATQLSSQEYYDVVIDIFQDENYGVKYFSDDGYLLFKRGAGQEKNKEAFEMFNKNAKKVFSRYEMFEVEYIDDFIDTT